MGAPLNYLGALPGPGLSMPGAVPGVGGPQDPALTATQAAGGMAGAPMPLPPVGAPPVAAPDGFGPVPVTGPGDAQYDVQAQSDGTAIIFAKNPDGTRGPALKIVKLGKPAAGPGPQAGAPQ